MTPERQQIVIAESRGWKRHSELNNAWVAPWQVATPLVVDLLPLPDYLNSRGAMSEALAGLTEREKRTCWEMLYLNVNDSIFWDANTCPRSCFRCLESTPAQLAEAYLRTKGLWEE